MGTYVCMQAAYVYIHACMHVYDRGVHTYAACIYAWFIDQCMLDHAIAIDHALYAAR